MRSRLSALLATLLLSIWATPASADASATCTPLDLTTIPTAASVSFSPSSGQFVDRPAFFAITQTSAGFSCVDVETSTQYRASIASAIWRFDDGCELRGLSASRTFNSPGIKRLSVQVSYRLQARKLNTALWREVATVKVYSISDSWFRIFPRHESGDPPRLWPLLSH